MHNRRALFTLIFLMISSICVVVVAQETTPEATRELEATAEANPDAFIITGDQYLDQAGLLEAYRAGYQDGFLEGKFAEQAEFTDPQSEAPIVGGETISEAIRNFFTNTFTNITINPTNFVFAGNTVVVEFLFTGTNIGSFMEQPPANIEVSVPMVAIYETENGQITRARLYYDTRSVLVQLGYLSLDGMRGADSTPEATPST